MYDHEHVQYTSNPYSIKLTNFLTTISKSSLNKVLTALTKVKLTKILQVVFNPDYYMTKSPTNIVNSSTLNTGIGIFNKFSKNNILIKFPVLI